MENITFCGCGISHEAYSVVFAITHTQDLSTYLKWITFSRIILQSEPYGFGLKMGYQSRKCLLHLVLKQRDGRAV